MESRLRNQKGWWVNLEISKSRKCYYLSHGRDSRSKWCHQSPKVKRQRIQSLPETSQEIVECGKRMRNSMFLPSFPALWSSTISSLETREWGYMGNVLQFRVKQSQGRVEKWIKELTGNWSAVLMKKAIDLACSKRGNTSYMEISNPFASL